MAELGNVSAYLAKTHILHFCTQKSEYQISGVPNFYLGITLSILQSHFYDFVPTLLQKEKNNIPLKVDELPQVALCAAQESN